jgi:hypothetical protein
MGFDFSTAIYVPPPEMMDEINAAYGVTLGTKSSLPIPSNKKPLVLKKKTWSQEFLDSPEWKALRADFFATAEKVCRKCGSTDELQVDHIKPKSKYPELALDKSNLQILCWPCNRTKAAREE